MSRESRTRLEQLLSNPSLQDALTKKLQTVRNESGCVRLGDEEFYPHRRTYEEVDLATRVYRDDWIIRSQFDQGKLRPVFEKFVLSKLPNPKPITVEDLEQVAFEQLSGIAEPSAIAEAYPRFVAHVCVLLDEGMVGLDDDAYFEGKHSDPFDFGNWTYPKDEAAIAEIEELTGGGAAAALWENAWPERGFCFIVTIVFHATELRKTGLIVGDLPSKRMDDSYGEPRVGFLVGDASRRAMKAAEAELRPAMSSILESFRILAQFRHLEEELRSMTAPVSELDVPWPAHQLQMVKRRETRLDPPFSMLISPFGKLFFSECISACLASEDTLARRMRNAIHLIAEADSHDRPAIGLALCFAAIEALVCTGNRERRTSDEVKRNVAALLEPDGSQRLGATEKIGRLYGKRCRALHGDAIEDDKLALWQTRDLTAGVLGAAIEWRDYQGRCEDKTDRRSFLEHLEDAATSGRRMVGIPEELRRCLPLDT